MKLLGILLCLAFFENAIAQSKTVDPLSFTSLNIEIYSSTGKLGTATGFIIQKKSKFYLITNLHVLTGKDYYSNAIIDSLQRIPIALGIWQNTKVLGNWKNVIETLYLNNTKRWIECANDLNKNYDLAALQLENIPEDIKFYPFDFTKAQNDSLLIQPGTPALIIGFPYGLASDGKFAIWKTGHVASDLDLDANGLPVFMIDATTRPGMSGSLVFVRLTNYTDRKGTTYMGSTVTSFIGIYSSQSNLEEIGYVWKPSVLKKLYDKLP